MIPFEAAMGERNLEYHSTKFSSKSETLPRKLLKATKSSSPVILANGRVHEVCTPEYARSKSVINDKRHAEKGRNEQGRKLTKQNAVQKTNDETEAGDCSYNFNRLFPQPGTQIENEATTVREESPRIKNYQIKSVRKGLPVIDPRDATVQRIRMKGKDLRITPYWICQRKKTETKRNAVAWIFSSFAIFICVVCPLTSFASDVAFYVTCSDHYNHTAEILAEVREKYGDGSSEGAKLTLDNGGLATIDNGSPIRNPSPAKTPIMVTPASDMRPSPLLSRTERSVENTNSGLRVLKGRLRRRAQTHERRILQPRRAESKKVSNSQTVRQRTLFKSRKHHKHKNMENVNLKSNARQQSVVSPQKHDDNIITVRRNSRQIPYYEVFYGKTNFEVQIQPNDTGACDSHDEVIRYMLTDKAAEELEAHRHVTIDIFEPVFILGSFPSLVLCILTRLVVLVTGHRNFLSAFVINIACMPLQLVTGALSVHSASYHLGRKGFECWHCAPENDCAGMGPLWWLQDGVTKTLIVSIATKIMDGVAGGVVLFIVTIRLLWSGGGHATFWWNFLRGVAIFGAFVFCVTVSPILVITPALAVMRLEFMELATPFPGLKSITSALMAMMGLGLACWGLSFAVLFIYLTYSMYMYCRERTIDH